MDTPFYLSEGKNDIFNSWNTLTESFKTSKPCFWGFNSESKKIYRVKRIKNNEIPRTETIIYSLGAQLGYGATSKVFELIPNDPKKKTKAVKIANTNELFFFEKEYNKLLKLPQSEGVQLPPHAFFPGCCRTDKLIVRSMIIMPKYNGALYEFHDKMTPGMKIEAMRQLIQGLSALHTTGIYPGDIDLNNIMYRLKENKYRYDFIDFGFACVKSSPMQNNDDIREKRRFRFAEKADIRDLGNVFKRIVFGWDCFHMNEIKYEDMIQRNLLPGSADLINYMCSNKRYRKEKKLPKLSMQEAQKIFLASIPQSESNDKN